MTVLSTLDASRTVSGQARGVRRPRLSTSHSAYRAYTEGTVCDVRVERVVGQHLSFICINQTNIWQWRQFPFFDALPVKDVHDLASPPELFKSTPEISTVSTSTSGVLVADIHGSVHLLDKDFETVASWLAHVGGRVTHMAERRGILVTLGEEDSVRHPLLKIWELGRIDPKTGAPNLLRSVKVQHTQRPHPVSTIALSASLSHLAVGLGDGTVLLYRHLDQSLFSGSTSLTSVPKPRVIHESPTEPVTGLGFREPNVDDGGAPTLHLFIVTTNRVLCYQASGRGSGGSASVVDEVGCGLGCATMDWKRRDMVIAREEAIYTCGVDGRGPCYAYEGHKSSVHTHLNYLVIVSPPFAPSASAASATVRNYVARSGNASNTEITKVTVFDPPNKFVAYTGTFTDGVREVISQWGNIYIMSNDGNLTCLKEKPTSAKLEMMYKKSQYTLALNVAKTQRLDASSVADIHRQYGDHLYSKGDYDGAMQQYLQTIGHLQASYVIRKFLDAQRIHNLVTYLQELHSLGLANSDHTTLLLNTYTKLKDVARLDSFIKAESRRSSSVDGEKDELPFDLDTAIRVCRQAGYFEHASYLAKKYERHEDYLRIQIEDAGNYKDALSYLRRLGNEAAEANLARYGRAMLESLPDETTQLLIDLCTSTGPLTAEPDEQPPSARQASPSSGPGSSYLSYLALNRTSPAAPTPSADAAGASTPTASTIRPRDQPSRRESSGFDGSDSQTATPIPQRSSTLPKLTLPTPVKRPSPRIYFAHFVDHLDNFVTFLETVALKRWGQAVDEAQESSVPAVIEPAADGEADKQDQVAVWNTLLELYLTLPGGEGQTKTMRDKALLVLKSDKIPYDVTHALILCSTRQYTPGLVLLWERMGMYEEVLRFWMDKDKEGSSPEASNEVIKCLNSYGPTNRHLYPLVLRFLTSTPALLSKHTADLGQILEYINSEKIMPPLGVIQVLSRNGVASVGLVKQWLLTRIKESREEIQTDKQLTDSYRMETRTKLKQVEDLSDPENPRVFHVTRCSSCGGQLDLPSVHFMCNHSYHQRCLADHDTECPSCARANGVIREIRRNNERLADQHDLFLSDVKESGFDAIASAFGRGVLNTTRSLETDIR
ncbi:hypothetical protein GLOTRDRAFT_114433 [Gloeophyllum trabeum ATCC 11539]|uniref:RING-type domain-containing protein n=1 Tax=Gloeophyllum trabeum (strain ATCC 11539 / FP-39264 / Madison 617) TaxID=670483 RepID=S7QD66_GLOTA|nr:uncharacterized protein GLOTRDRAFT_114433 [Gloeophyllum trabeum ATCC 11539]EPQ57796.1 hypothetical protein GLOTRDRAFT_114433 [Gloeophyllum trabeum ATCC 11539]